MSIIAEKILCFESKVTAISKYSRDLQASALYVLLYNNLVSEKKDNKSILMAGGVAGW